MARIFISHSSHNNERAIHVSDWLSATGWEDVFLDPGPRARHRCGRTLEGIVNSGTATARPFLRFSALNGSHPLVGVLVHDVEREHEWSFVVRLV